MMSVLIKTKAGLLSLRKKIYRHNTVRDFIDDL